MSNFSEFDEVAKSQGQARGKLDDWFRPAEGINKVRILSGYEPLARHFRGKGVKSLICIGKDKGCPLHGPDEQPANVKYLMWIVDRKSGEIKIGEFGYTILKTVADWKNTEDFGFEKLPDYDIIIKKTVSGPRPSDVEYTVLPARQNTPLTEDEMNTFIDKTPIEKIVERMKEKTVASLKPVEVDKKMEEVEDEIRPEDIPF